MLKDYGLGLGFLADGVAAALKTYVFHKMDGILILIGIKSSNQITANLQQQIEQSLQLAGTTGDIGLPSSSSNQSQIEFHSSQYSPYILANDLDNIIYGYSGNDAIYSLAGNDTVYGGDGDDTISTAQGNDVINAGSGSDIIYAGSGDDTILVLANNGENDTVSGGSGTDSLSINIDCSGIYYTPISWYGLDGSGVSSSGLNTDSSVANIQSVLNNAVKLNVHGWGSVTFDGIENLSITASDYGYNDLLIVQGVGSYDGKNGVDAIYADWSIATQAIHISNSDLTVAQDFNGSTIINIERWLVKTGSGDDVIASSVGNYNDEIYSNAGNDTLNGGGGNDLLKGGAGDDTYYFGTGLGNDVIEEGEGGIDRVIFIGLNRSDVSYSVFTNFNPNDSLRITINSTGEQLTINRNFDVDKAWNVEEFQFNDGVFHYDELTNSAPTATNLSAAETYTEDTPLNLTDIIASDSDSANITATLTLSNIAAGSLNTATSGAVTSTYNAGTGVWTASGAIADVNALLAGITFTPATNFNDNFTISTSISDGVATPLTGSKSFTGIAVNDPPVAQNNSYTATEDTALTGNMIADLDSVAGKDSDVDNDTLTLSKINGSNFTVGSAITLAHGSLIVTSSNGSFSYTPALNSTAGDSFSYEISDGHGGVSTATVNINVTPVNDPPVAQNNSYTATEDTALTGNMIADLDSVAGKDSDVDNGTLTLSKINGSNFIVGSAITLAHGSLTVTSSNGSFSYTPALNSTAGDSFSYEISDGHGGVSTATVNINVTPVGNTNHAPVLVTPATINYIDTAFVDNFATKTGTLVGSDVDTGTTLTYGISGLGVTDNGLTVSKSNAYGTLIVTKATGAYSFVPNSAAIESLNAKVSDATLFVTVSDGVLSATPQAFTVEITQQGVTESNNGNDTLTGTAGNDTLNGLAGADTMIGGRGNDSYYVDNVGDVVVERNNEGMDTVYASVSYTLAPNVENLVLMGTDNLNGYGNTQNNVLNGNAGNNILDGQGGTDTMIGGAGNDTYYIDNRGDRVTENAGGGNDTVYSSINYTLGNNVENLILTGTAADGTGNTLDNHLMGNNANNSLDGGAGADILDGQDGRDTLQGESGNDTLIGGNGADTLIGGLGKDTYNLAETTAATDTVRIARGDSLVNSYDLATGFKLGTRSNPTNAGVDRLDLASSDIANNVNRSNGTDSGVIHSHHISNGIISFDDINNYTTPLTIATTNLADVFHYLQD